MLLIPLISTVFSNLHQQQSKQTHSHPFINQLSFHIQNSKEATAWNTNANAFSHVPIQRIQKQTYLMRIWE